MDIPKYETDLPRGILFKNVISRNDARITNFAWSPLGELICIVDSQRRIEVLDAKEKTALRSFNAGSEVPCIAWNPNGESIIFSRNPGILEIANINSRGRPKKIHLCEYVIEFLQFSPDGQKILAASAEGRVFVIGDGADKSFECDGEGEEITAVSWGVVSGVILIGYSDGLILQLDVHSGEIEPIANHGDRVNEIIVIPSTAQIITCSDDMTWRVFRSRASGVYAQAIVEGHTDAIISIAVSNDSRLVVTKSWDNTVRIWSLTDLKQMARIWDMSSESKEAVAFHPNKNLVSILNREGFVRVLSVRHSEIVGKESDSTTYHLNAKVVLVGETGTGKSALGRMLSERVFEATISTFGAKFWQIPLKDPSVQLEVRGVVPEITLWDFAGQPEYHLVHQLFLDDADAALLLCDASRPSDPFRGISYWADALRKQAPKHIVKFLVAARCDVSPPAVSISEIEHALTENDLHKYFRTSAMTGEGVQDLWDYLLKKIPWDNLPKTSRPELFQHIRAYVLERKESGATFISLEEVERHALSARKVIKVGDRADDPKKSDTDGKSDVEAVIGLLQSQGLVHKMEPYPKMVIILLKPELINQYASAIIREARNNENGIGAVSERSVIRGQIILSNVDQASPADEKVLLEYAVESLVGHDLCFREMGMLVFPSQINQVRPSDHSDRPSSEVSYQFSGSIEAIYASLVVRLSYTEYFRREGQWKYSAEFSRGSGRMGFSVKYEGNASYVDVYFRGEVSDLDKVTFIRFIVDHLKAKGIDVKERIVLACPSCKEEVSDRRAVNARVAAGVLDIPCQYCGAGIIIPRSIEEKYGVGRMKIEEEIRNNVKGRTKKEVDDIRKVKRKHHQVSLNTVNILHISDMHIENSLQAEQWFSALKFDVRNELGINKVDCLVVSGDIGNVSSVSEYESAISFLKLSVDDFAIDSTRIVIVPGNHDLNWAASKNAYKFVYAGDTPTRLDEGTFIPAGDTGILLRDNEIYKQRFANFSENLFKNVYNGMAYPEDTTLQYNIFKLEEEKILFCGFNTCWQIDHHFRSRASINQNALAKAMLETSDEKYDGWIKLAIGHHPPGHKDGFEDNGFTDQLAARGYSAYLHGHVHEAGRTHHEYDEKRGLYIIGAGTFGARPHQMQPGIPLQYNMISIDSNGKGRVSTRRKERADAPWFGDARWGRKNAPRSYYDIQLNRKNIRI